MFEFSVRGMRKMFLRFVVGLLIFTVTTRKFVEVFFVAFLGLSNQTLNSCFSYVFIGLVEQLRKGQQLVHTLTVLNGQSSLLGNIDQSSKQIGQLLAEMY